jgi:Kef-type K+ transport system membrane component KefB
VGVAGIPIALAIVAVALVSKIVGCGAGARLGGCTAAEALRIGVGMTSRGEVGLIVASIGLASGIVSEAVFASVVVMVLVTTLVTPIALRVLYREPQTTGSAETVQTDSSQRAPAQMTGRD